MRHFLLLFLLLLAQPLAAATLEGPFRQGDLVIARAEPGSTVQLDGKDIRVGADGTFLLAFGRDADASAELVIRAAGGGEWRQTYVVQPGDWEIQRIDGLPESKVSPRKSEDLARIKDDNRQIGAVRATDTRETWFLSGFQWPALGPISGVFGSQRILNGEPKRYHNGVDIAGPVGTPVRATASGRVALVHPDMFYSGKTVMIDHGFGLSSVYIHMSEITVKNGDVVDRGQPIGAIGQTGRATGPHLHWGMSLFGTHIDPARLVGPMPQ